MLRRSRAGYRGVGLGLLLGLLLAGTAQAQTVGPSSTLAAANITGGTITNTPISGSTGAFTTVLIGTGTLTTQGALGGMAWDGPASWATVTSPADGIRLNTNNYLIGNEFLGPTSTIVTGVMAGMVVPSSAVAGSAGGGTAEQTFAAYGQTNSTDAGIAAISGIGFLNVANSSVWGLVGNVANFATPTGASTGFGGGATLYGAELDMNLISKAGPAAPDVTAIGLHIVNSSSTDVASGSLETAINIAATNPSYPWDTGVNFATGGAKVAVNIGELATGASQASQVVNFNAETSGSAVLIDSLQEDDAGNLNVTLGTTAAFFHVIGGGIAVGQGANGDVSLYQTRATDTSATGNFLQGINAAGNTILYNVDVNGNATFTNVTSGGVFAQGANLGITKACTVIPTGITIKGGIITAITGGTCT